MYTYVLNMVDNKLWLLFYALKEHALSVVLHVCSIKKLIQSSTHNPLALLARILVHSSTYMYAMT